MNGARRIILTHLLSQMAALEADLIRLTNQEKEDFERLPDTLDAYECHDVMEDEIHALELGIKASNELRECVQAALDR